MNGEELQQSGLGCTSGGMGRPKLEDRANVIDRDSPTMGVRLTPSEHEALQRLIALLQSELDERGLTVRASGAAVLRSLLRREAEARGVWPGDAAKPAKRAGKARGPRKG